MNNNELKRYPNRILRMHLPGSPRQTGGICTLQQRLMSRVTTTFPLYFDPLQKVKLATLMGTWNSLKKLVIQQRVYPLVQLPTTWRRLLPAKPMNILTCILVWRRLPGMRVLTRLLTGWKRLPKLSVHMQTGSRKHWIAWTDSVYR